MKYVAMIEVDEQGYPRWMHDIPAELALNDRQLWTAQALHSAYHSIQAALGMEREVLQTNPRLPRVSGSRSTRHL